MYYDLLVIGDDFEGTERAISASRTGLRVAIVRSTTPTIPLEIIRKGADHVANSSLVSMEALRLEVSRLLRQQSLNQQAEFHRLGIETLSGTVRFISEASVEICDQGFRQTVSATELIIASGTESRQTAAFDCDGQRILFAESLLEMNEIPRSSIVVGAGMTGLAVAILLAKLGVEVTIVDDHISLFDVCSALEGAFDEIPSLPIAFRLGDEVIGTTLRSDRQASARLSSGRVIAADTIVVCVGRIGKTEHLNLEEVGVGIDERGRLWCDPQGQTWSPRIRAVGKVVGFQPNRSSRLTRSRLSVDFLTTHDRQ